MSTEIILLNHDDVFNHHMRYENGFNDFDPIPEDTTEYDADDEKTKTCYLYGELITVYKLQIKNLRRIYARNKNSITGIISCIKIYIKQLSPFKNNICSHHDYCAEARKLCELMNINSVSNEPYDGFLKNIRDIPDITELEKGTVDEKTEIIKDARMGLWWMKNNYSSNKSQ